MGRSLYEVVKPPAVEQPRRRRRHREPRVRVSVKRGVSLFRPILISQKEPNSGSDARQTTTYCPDASARMPVHIMRSDYPLISFY